MTTDPIDELLDDAAPRVAAHDPALDALLHQMVHDARDSARAAAPQRRRKIGLAAALAAAMVVGGGGAAVAAGLVAWPTGYETPDNEFSFSLPSGRACEIRLVIGARIAGTEQAAVADGDAPSPEVQRAQEVTADWLRKSNLLATIDLAASQTEVEDILRAQQDAGMTILIGKDGWLTDAKIASHREADADDAYAFAVDRAVRRAMQEQLRSAGVSESAWTFASAGGVKCAAE